MPRFHFPIVDGTRLEDPVGIELTDNHAARQQAERIAKHVSNVGHRTQRKVLAIDETGEEIHKAPVTKED